MHSFSSKNQKIQGQGLAWGIASGMIVLLLLVPFVQPANGKELPQFVLFLGRFHPMILHFPIAWIVLGSLLEFLSTPLARRWAPAVEPSLIKIIWFTAAASSFGTVLLGWMLSFSSDYDPRLIKIHQIAGVTTAIGSALVFALLFRAETGAWRWSAIVLTLGAMTVAGHFGANITHGENYLTEYAPAPLRFLLGGKPLSTASVSPTSPSPPINPVTSIGAPTPKGSPAPTTPITPNVPPLLSGTKSDLPPSAPQSSTVEKKLVFTEVIQPAFTASCVVCHGPTKSKGGLRLDSFEAIMRGGDGGPAVVPGDPEKSEIIRRIHVPVDDDDHMPPKGHAPMPDAQVAVLVEWIKEGASATAPLTGEVPVTTPPQIATAKADSKPAVLITDEAEPAPPSPQEVAAEAKAALEVQSRLDKIPPVPGALSLISPAHPQVEFTVGAHYREFTDENLATLAPVGQDLIWLNLSRAKTSDAGLKALTNFPKLEKLVLSSTTIGDSSLEVISTLNQLEVLNLDETTVTDQGVSQLQGLTKLKKLYLWKTAVTAAGEAALKSRLPGVEIVRELPPTKVPPAPAPASPESKMKKP